MGAARGPRLLGALVVVLAVDADPVRGRGAGEGGGGEEEGGELHFGTGSGARALVSGFVCLIRRMSVRMMFALL